MKSGSSQRTFQADNSVLKRIARIRANGLLNNKRISPVKNESLARNFAARKVALPLFKHEFGKSLWAVVLGGSAQLGIRKSKPKSDVDLCLVVSGGFLTKLGDSGAKARRLEEALKKSTGIEFSVNLFSPELFVWYLKHSLHKFPFQIIFGRKFSHAQLGERIFKKVPKWRERELRENPKYQ
ncbi:MAG: hypothetical protein NTY48_03780 [Candidatus Diapherotrites archaeon]|nr:hypothetical protein [Candidatus Diapherotrites archaeon]